VYSCDLQSESDIATVPRVEAFPVAQAFLLSNPGSEVSLRSALSEVLEEVHRFLILSKDGRELTMKGQIQAQTALLGRARCVRGLFARDVVLDMEREIGFGLANTPHANSTDNPPLRLWISTGRFPRRKGRRADPRVRFGFRRVIVRRSAAPAAPRASNLRTANPRAARLDAPTRSCNWIRKADARRSG
jgi:hypothetical protein